jgi:alkylation response protein AidB-like acyl-CoA dehydrogenase
MDFGFNDEQELSRATARKFLEAECSMTLVRRMIADETAHAIGLWRRMVDLGWLGITIPAELGGLGGSYLDLVVILEEMGRALLPGPFFTAVLLGGAAVATGGTAAQRAVLLPQIAAGELIATLALAETDGRYDAGGVTLEARRVGGGWVLRGTKLFVPDTRVAQQVVVVARTGAGARPEDGITLFCVPVTSPGVAVTPLRTVDLTRRLTQVTFENVHVPETGVLGTPDAGWPVVARVLDQATVGLCVEMVGTAQRALDLTVAYARERVQFGKPIGSFQAVKHRCVDMMVEVENARSLAYYAAWTVDEDRPEARQAVPMAKAYASDMCKNVCSQAIQLHGGIGFTWEHDIHLYYRRALGSEASFGSARVHRELVAQALRL